MLDHADHMIPDFDCTRFPEGTRLRSICDGTSGLPEFGPGNTREAYIKLWLDQPPPMPVQEVVPECIHRGGMLETRLCDLCGVKGQPFEVLSCAIHTECSLHPKHSKVKSCAACEDFTTPDKSSETAR